MALHFISVDASRGGQYICNASITVPELSIEKTSSLRYNVTVQRKHKYQIKYLQALSDSYNNIYYSSSTNTQYHGNSV